VNYLLHRFKKKLLAMKVCNSIKAQKSYALYITISHNGNDVLVGVPKE